MKIASSNKTAVDLVLPLAFASFVFYSMYKKDGDVKNAGIVALIVAGVGYVITSQVTKEIIAAATDSLSASKTTAIAQQYGASSQQVTDAKSRASIVYHSFFDNFIQNEPQAIAAVNQCQTADEVKLMCNIYQATYGKSLQADFNDNVVYIAQPDINTLVTSNWS